MSTEQTVLIGFVSFGRYFRGHKVVITTYCYRLIYMVLYEPY